MPVTTVTPFPLGGPIPAFYADLIDPFVGLARASAVTKTIKASGTEVCLVPERNPLLLAKEIATLDHFSGGRFSLYRSRLAQGGDGDHGRQLRAPLDADPGGHRQR